MGTMLPWSSGLQHIAHPVYPEVGDTQEWKDSFRLICDPCMGTITGEFGTGTSSIDPCMGPIIGDICMDLREGQSPQDVPRGSE